MANAFVCFPPVANAFVCFPLVANAFVGIPPVANAFVGIPPVANAFVGNRLWRMLSDVIISYYYLPKANASQLIQILKQKFCDAFYA